MATRKTAASMRPSTSADFAHLEVRVDRLDERLDVFGAQLGGVSRAVEGISSRLEAWRDDLRRATAERPSIWPNVIMGAGVLLTIGVLALTPVAWLAVANFNSTNQNEQVNMQQAMEIARLQATAEILLEDRRDRGLRLQRLERGE